MRVGKRKIRDGHEFNRFFKRSDGKTLTVKKEALLEDTLKWIKLVVRDTLDQTKQIANYLQSDSVRETCKRIWSFCFHHFQYEKDEERKEQIRTPNRAWMDRHNYQGIDCDCFTVFICSMLQNLNIPYLMRITKYPKDKDFSHIYPVAFAADGKEIIIDCVVHCFDYEVAYTQKKDIPMELQILSGIEQEQFNEFGDKITFEHDLPIDAEDLFLDEDMELEGLEGRAERQARRAARKAKRNRPKSVKKAERKAKRQQFISDFKKGNLKDKIRSGLHIVNKGNPASVLLRGGILASMKLNLFKVASRIRFAYWTTQQARNSGMDMSKFNQLQRIRERLEKIYFRAGGKPESLKKAILSGRGNRDKMVALNGLGSLPLYLPMDEDDMRTILGDDIYYGELNGFEGLHGLGEPITTSAAIAAASGSMGIVAGLLKKIGNLFKKGTKAAQQFKIQENTENQEEKTRKFSVKNIINKLRNKVQERRLKKGKTKTPPVKNERIDIPDDEFANDPPEEEFELVPEDEFTLQDPFETGETPPQSKQQESEDKSDEDTQASGNWITNNKGLAIGIGTGVLGLTALGIYLAHRAKKKKAEKAKANKKEPQSFNGVSAKKRKTPKKTSRTKRKFVPKSRGLSKRKTGTSTLKIQPIM